LGLVWISGPCWSDKPYSVELEGSTDAGEDMIISLGDISNEELQEYVENFDIDYNVAMWWPDGKPGRGVPFDNQAEHVEDYEQWLAQIKDVIAESSGKAHKRDLTNEQQVYVDRFKEAYEELQAMGIGIATAARTTSSGFTGND
jgi:6-pyruvoyl-tetrahydropterin synthase